MIRSRPEPELLTQVLNLMVQAREEIVSRAHDSLPGTLALSIQVTNTEATISASYVNLIGNIETHLTRMRY